MAERVFQVGSREIAGLQWGDEKDESCLRIIALHGFETETDSYIYSLQVVGQLRILE